VILVSQLALALWLAASLTAFTVFAAHTYVTKQLPVDADRTSRMVFHAGRAVLWCAAVVSASALASAVALVIVKALGGGT